MIKDFLSIRERQRNLREDPKQVSDQSECSFKPKVAPVLSAMTGGKDNDTPISMKTYWDGLNESGG